ncbi:hypothetical protein LCGC14_1903190, partial [marine sediment metagenome]
CQEMPQDNLVLRISYVVLRNTHHARRNTIMATEEIVLRYFLTKGVILIKF